jgi:hypothetical protein
VVGRARRIVLEIEEGSEPLAGRLTDDGGARSFCGWLELATALQAALADPAPAPATEEISE